MRRHTNNNDQRPLSAAAQAAMARAAGQSNVEAAPRPSYSTPRRKLRSLFYRIIYASVIRGSRNPHEQSQKAASVFRQSLLGCILCVYTPLMFLGFTLVNHASVKQTVASTTSLDQLKRQSFPHGSFMFGPTSHDVSIPKDAVWKPSLNPSQKELLDDEEIDVEVEKKRCERYNYGYTDQTLSRRRRLFLGALIADDSWEVLRATSMEAYNIFHTVSFIESNATQNMSPRNWKYGLQSENLLTLQQMFGPKTKVSVEYYICALNSTNPNTMLTEHLQREGINLRWKLNGMKGDDVAIIADADETFSRDYLRALQICDLKMFRPGQTCRENIWGNVLVFEGSPNCVTNDRRWYNPTAILGECVDQIGDSSSHPSALREWRESHGTRLQGYGGDGNYSLIENEWHVTNAGSNYPLWTANDMRASDGGVSHPQKDGGASGYHFHNFFMSTQDIRFKYSTYGHAWPAALTLPLSKVHEDLELGAQCARGMNTTKYLDFAEGSGNSLPIYYLNEATRSARHLQWQNIVNEEEWENAKRQG